MFDWLRKTIGSMAQRRQSLENPPSASPAEGAADMRLRAGPSTAYEGPALDHLAGLAANATSVGDQETVTALYRTAVATDAANADLRLALVPCWYG